jgi:predicted dehydrogenase
MDSEIETVKDPLPMSAPLVNTIAPLIETPLRSSGGKLRVAVIGCGANAAINHLPVIAASRHVEPAVLVDMSIRRAEDLARKYGVPAVVADYRAIEGMADAAIVALPNDLHAPVTIELLNRGIHVLVEKPMALTTTDCDDMIRAAKHSGMTLAVGLEFRFFSDTDFIRQFLAAGLLGRITKVDLRLGIIFDWPVESDYLFDKERAGGGVLMDLGAHVIDLLLWWMGDYESVAYADDAMGGVESNCAMQVKFAGGATGTVEISRTRNLRNSCIFTGTRGRLEIELWSENPELRLELNGHNAYLSGRLGGDGVVLDCGSALERQIDNFAQAIQNHREPMVSGQEGRRAIQFIESCYRNRRPLQEPWAL